MVWSGLFRFGLVGLGQVRFGWAWFSRVGSDLVFCWMPSDCWADLPQCSMVGSAVYVPARGGVYSWWIVLFGSGGRPCCLSVNEIGRAHV